MITELRNGWLADWSHGRVEARALGGMIGPVSFRLPSSRVIEPLAVAPWVGETLPLEIPGHLRNLRGVFPCLPFGVSGRPRDIAGEWAGIVGSQTPEPPHGHAPNGHWRRLAGREPLAIVYDHVAHADIVSESQTLMADANGPAIEVLYEATVRRTIRLPFGYHVIARWPERPGTVELRPGSFAFGLTYPGVVEPGVIATRPSTEFRSLDEVPARDGGSVDLARPDFVGPLEDVVQLCGISGVFEIHYPGERAGLRIVWDPKALPSCLLWFSRYGLQDAPWHGRFTGIGIEPISSAFDFAASVSTAVNPINRRGIATSIELRSDQAWTTTLRLEAFET